MNLKNVKNLWFCINILYKKVLNKTCEQCEASTSISPMKRFKLGITKTDYIVKEELECQSAFVLVLKDTQTTQTWMINLPYPALWPKICDRKVIDHLILYGLKEVPLTNYPQNESSGHFNDSHCFCKLANNKFILRQQSMHSETTDHVFCSCCPCFD
jgi:hypothetical protein